MSLYGGSRDINLIKSLNREIIGNIIEQQVGYYKPKLDETNINLYGEGINKTWIGPVLIQCLISRGKYEWKTDELGPDTKRIFEFRFLKDHLVDANVVPEVGDALLYNEDYFEVNGVDQNQFILGKDPDYSYSDSVQNFGASLSIILTAHYSRAEKLGIKQDRL